MHVVQRKYSQTHDINVGKTYQKNNRGPKKTNRSLKQRKRWGGKSVHPARRSLRCIVLKAQKKKKERKKKKKRKGSAVEKSHCFFSRRYRLSLRMTTSKCSFSHDHDSGSLLPVRNMSLVSSCIMPRSGVRSTSILLEMVV